MAVKTFKVVFNRQVAGSHLAGGDTVVLTKAQAEAGNRKLGKEPVTITGPIEDAKVVQVTAENAEAAVTAVRTVLGANEAEGELLVVETGATEKKSGR